MYTGARCCTQAGLEGAWSELHRVPCSLLGAHVGNLAAARATRRRPALRRGCEGGKRFVQWRTARRHCHDAHERPRPSAAASHQDWQRAHQQAAHVVVGVHHVEAVVCHKDLAGWQGVTEGDLRA